MNIEQINKQLSHLNPYIEPDKSMIKDLLIARRNLIKIQDKKRVK